MSKKTGGVVVLVLCLALSIFLLNCGSSNSRPSGVLFVTSIGSNTVQSYAINLSNGDLSQLNTSAPAGSGPGKILLDPTGGVAYVLNTASNSISPYTVNKDGSLSKSTDAPIPGTGAADMTRDSAGKFLFVVTRGDVLSGGTTQPQLAVFGVQPGSASITAIGTPQTLSNVPTSIAVITLTTPTAETLLYVTSDKDLIAHNDNTVSVFSVDSSGNVSLPLPGSPYTTGTLPSAVLPVFTQSNFMFVYVADGKPNNNVVTFQVCIQVSSNCSSSDVTNAKMTPINPAVPVGTSPLNMITDATRRFLYVANSESNNISAFSLSATDGRLTALNPATVSTGATPVALVLHPNGEFIYSANSGSGSGEGSVSVFTVNLTSGSLGGGGQVSAPQAAGLVAK